ncbi:MATE family efflux transporter [Rhodobacteraceae bacterium WD3A24]|nr:MATE family efflux transporter [Rhodobacteraceae bacterium WD3A24]
MTDTAALSPQPARTHLRAALVLGLPLVGSHLAQFALQITDTLMLGWYGVESLAGGVLGTTVFFTIFIFGTGFANAVMPMVATAAAAGAPDEVRRATRMGMWLSAGFAALMLPVMWWSGPLLRLLGQPDVAVGLAQDYLRIAGWGMAPALVVMVLKSHLAALERTQVVLWVTVAAVILNAAINWAFIFGNWGAPELGVRGAALASVVVQTATAAALAAYSGWLPALRRYALFARLWRPDAVALARVFRIGWPIGLALLAESGLFAATSILMGWIGTRELAAHGISIEITAMVFMIHLGLSNAATVMVGRARGRGDADGLRLGALVACALSAGVALATMVLYVAAPAALIGLFVAPDDPARPAIIAIGVPFILVAAVFQLADSAQVMAMGLLRGLQDTRVPMVIATIAYWVLGIPASWVLGFPLGLGGVGVWLGLVLGLSVAAVLLMTRFWRRAPRPA